MNANTTRTASVAMVGVAGLFLVATGTFADEGEPGDGDTAVPTAILELTGPRVEVYPRLRALGDAKTGILAGLRLADGECLFHIKLELAPSEKVIEYQSSRTIRIPANRFMRKAFRLKLLLLNESGSDNCSVILSVHDERTDVDEGRRTAGAAADRAGCGPHFA